MARFIYFLVCLTLIAGGALFVLKRPDGQPWLNMSEPTVSSLSHTLKNQAQQLSGQVSRVATVTTQAISTASDEDIEVFRWQDINGQWHYSDTPNSEGQSETVVLKASDITVLPPMPYSLTSVTNKAPNAQSQLDFSQPLERISQGQETLEGAKRIQQLVDARKEQLDQQIKQSQ